MSSIWLSIATVTAIIAGPILAIITSRWLDKSRAQSERKMEIFRTLMRTRTIPLHWEHVCALNLIEVEFRKNESVLNAWKEYFNFLKSASPSIEEVNDFSQGRNIRITKLIRAIAEDIGMKIPEMDIFELNYIPQNWLDIDVQQALIRQGVIKILYEGTPISMKIHQDNCSPFPPPPSSP